MSTTREKFYRCTLVTGTERLTGHVRAWSERDAAQVFREELAVTGVKASGSILVKSLSGGKEHEVELAAS